MTEGRRQKAEMTDIGHGGGCCGRNENNAGIRERLSSADPSRSPVIFEGEDIELGLHPRRLGTAYRFKAVEISFVSAVSFLISGGALFRMVSPSPLRFFGRETGALFIGQRRGSPTAISSTKYSSALDLDIDSFDSVVMFFFYYIFYIQGVSHHVNDFRGRWGKIFKSKKIFSFF